MTLSLPVSWFWSWVFHYSIPRCFSALPSMMNFPRINIISINLVSHVLWECLSVVLTLKRKVEYEGRWQFRNKTEMKISSATGSFAGKSRMMWLVCARTSYITYLMCSWASLSLSGNRNPWDVCVLRPYTERVLIHNQILTLLRETGYPHFISIPVIVLGLGFCFGFFLGKSLWQCKDELDK